LAFNKQFFATPEKLIDACKRYIQQKKQAPTSQQPMPSSHHMGRPPLIGGPPMGYGMPPQGHFGSGAAGAPPPYYGAPPQQQGRPWQPPVSQPLPPPVAGGWGSGGSGYNAPPLPPPAAAGGSRQSRWGASLSHNAPPQQQLPPQTLHTPSASPPTRSSGHIHPSRMAHVDSSVAGSAPPSAAAPSSGGATWRVGDPCQAKWRDGGWYDAIIDALPNYVGGGYMVRYLPAMHTGTVSAASLRPRV
jgi:hypothetical protein